MLALAVAAVAVVGARRALADPPTPSVSLRTSPSLVPVPAAASPVAVPAQGSLALAARGERLAGGAAAGRVVEQDAARPRPIGSVAKVMTALVTLEARPLASGAGGPAYTMDATDVALYRDSLAAGGSVVPVTAGEVFTERQLLLAMLLPSGNNIAETLARWVAGSRDAFVAMLNARATRLGMTGTHFADPSGFDDGTVSTADDLVTLGWAALAVPALSEVVATADSVLPDGTAIHNLDSLLGTEPGWLGIKTGSTNAAGGCLLFAARREASGAAAGDAADQVTLVGAVLGQPGLQDALSAAARVVDTAAPQFQLVDPARLAPEVTGSVVAAWGSASTVTLGPTEAEHPVVLRAGTELALSVTSEPVAAPVAAGARVGTLAASAGGAPVASWPVVTRAEVDGPGLGWKLRNG